MKNSLAYQMQKKFIEKKLTLSLAESCTGGALAAELTSIPGCSDYFLGSVVAYANETKTQVLGVSRELIQQEGAVSGPVVSLMAENVLKLTRSDYSLAISGIAGPSGGTPEKPVGTVWAAICSKEECVKVWSFYLKGHRQQIIEQSIQTVLFELNRLIFDDE